MADTPPPSPFPALTEAQSIFKQLIWNPLWAAGQLGLIAAIPELKLPVVDDIETWAEEDLRDWTFALLCEFIDVETIKLVNEAHQDAFEAASVELLTVAESSGGTSSPAYQKALADEETAFANFGRFYSAAS